MIESSWHHTGKYYNCTDFYNIDEDKLEEGLENIEKIVYDLENYKNKLIEDKNEMKLKEQSEVLQVVEISYGE